MKVSVVIAACNGFKYTKRQISILSHLYTHDEIIVSADELIDDTEVVVQGLADTRVKGGRWPISQSIIVSG